MMIRIFSSGKSGGAGPVNYLLSETDHNGKQRATQPEILEGNPNTTIHIINSIGRDWKYVSGAIAFRNNEHPSRAQMVQVIDRFKSTVCPGLNSSQFNSLFVLHRDKGNDEIHFVIPMMELSTGKRLNIHPPGKKNLALFNTLVQVMNHELGYAQVVADPLKLALPSYKLKSPEFKNEQLKSQQLQTYIQQAIIAGKMKNRDQLCQWLNQEMGLTITRHGKDYLSVKLPGEKKAHRLRGPLFAENANYRDRLEASRTDRVSVKLTDTEYQKQKNRLSELVSERSTNYEIAFSPARPVRLGGTKYERPNISNPKISTSIKPVINHFTSEEDLTMKIKKSNNYDKKIILEAQTAVRQNEAKLVPTPAPKLDFNHIKQRILEKSNQNTFSSNTAKAIDDLLATLGQIEQSINVATANISKAKNPMQRAMAEQQLRELMEHKIRLHRQLVEAKINNRASLGRNRMKM